MSERFDIYVTTERKDSEGRPFRRAIGSAWLNEKQDDKGETYQYLSLQLDALPPGGDAVGFPARKATASDDASAAAA